MKKTTKATVRKKNIKSKPSKKTAPGKKAKAKKSPSKKIAKSVSVKKDNFITISSNVIFRSENSSCLSIVDLKNGQYYKVEQLAAYIWILIASGKQLTEILDICSKKFKLPSKVKAEIPKFYKSLLIKNLITKNQNESKNNNRKTPNSNVQVTDITLVPKLAKNERLNSYFLQVAGGGC